MFVHHRTVLLQSKNITKNIERSIIFEFLSYFLVINSKVLKFFLKKFFLAPFFRVNGLMASVGPEKVGFSSAH